MRISLGLMLTAALMLPATALGQRRFVQDTLSPSTPGVVSCGFCATERFGVVFGSLGAPRRGLAPEDFPVEVEGIEIALGSANAESGCAASMVGGTVTASVELYVGDGEPPTDIVDLPVDEAWPGETLVWVGDAPLSLSAADESGQYSITFNGLEIRDEMEARIRVEEGVYFRAVVVVPPGPMGASPSCEGGGFVSPGGFPMRDNAGEDATEPFRGTERRSFIHALGIGWVWNSEGEGLVPVIPGNWGVRLSLFTFGPGPSGADAGMPSPEDAGSATGEDAGASPDAGGMALDAGTPDAGPDPVEDGCACRAASRPEPRAPLALFALALLWGWRRVRG